jgi:hypothetical protein
VYLGRAKPLWTGCGGDGRPTARRRQPADDIILDQHHCAVHQAQAARADKLARVTLGLYRRRGNTTANQPDFAVPRQACRRFPARSTASWRRGSGPRADHPTETPRAPARLAADTYERF